MADIRSYQMLIDGEWVDASDGGSFDSTNPATGEADGGFAWRNGQIQSRVEQIFTALGSLLRDTAQADSPWHGRVDSVP